MIVEKVIFYCEQDREQNSNVHIRNASIDVFSLLIKEPRCVLGFVCKVNKTSSFRIIYTPEPLAKGISGVLSLDLFHNGDGIHISNTYNENTQSR